MTLSIPKARSLARAFLKAQGTFDMSITGTHYLGIYNRRHAFELRFNYPDNIMVDPGLPIILLVSVKEVLLIQSEESFKIIDYCNSKKKIS